MAVDLKRLRLDIRTKLKVGRSALSNRVSALKERRPMSDEDALGVVARQVGLRIDRRYGYSADELLRIGDHEAALSGFVQPSKRPKSSVNRPSDQKTAKKTPTRAGLFKLLRFHDEVVKASRKPFVSGLGGTAVQRAFQGLHNRVKKVTNAPDHFDGDSLLGWAFNTSNPQLQLNDLKTKTKKNEQDGLRRVAQGSYQGFRNPASHNIDWGPTDDREVLELLGLASFLHRCVDRCLEYEAKMKQAHTGK